MFCHNWYELLFQFCVAEDGRLFTFGETDQGKLGMGDEIEKNANYTHQHVQNIDGHVTWVACGGSHTVCVTSKANFYMDHIHFLYF